MRLFTIALRSHPGENLGQYFHTAAAAEAWLFGPQGIGYLGRYREEYLVREADWREREQLMFNHGIYRSPPWTRELLAIADHYAHVSVDDPTMLAFTQSPEHGERNRQTRIKPGRYLQAHYPHLTPKQVAYYAEWFRSGQKPPKEVDGQLMFATTQDEIVEVYENGPDSCMHGDDCVRVYAAGDLAVAWVKSPQGDVLSRALCWPAKKVYGRVYPDDDENGPDLIARLRSLDYQHLHQSAGGFEGARLLKIETVGTYVMPYIDSSYGVCDDGEYWTMSQNYDYACSSTVGILEPVDDRPICDYCEERYDDGSTVYRYFSDRFGAEWCEYCADHNTFYCEGTERSYSDSNECVYVDGIGDCILEWAEQSEDVYVCDGDGEHYYEPSNPKTLAMFGPDPVADIEIFGPPHASRECTEVDLWVFTLVVSNGWLNELKAEYAASAAAEAMAVMVEEALYLEAA